MKNKLIINLSDVTTPITCLQIDESYPHKVFDFRSLRQFIIYFLFLFYS